MTCCTSCVTVVAMVFQLLSHFLPNSELENAGLGWWQLGFGQNKNDSWLVPVVHTIALFFDVVALGSWCDYSGDECRKSRDYRAAEEAKELSRFAGRFSACMKGCGCVWHLCFPKPGMVWCCVASAVSLVFTLISTCSSATEEYEPREERRKDPSCLA